MFFSGVISPTFIVTNIQHQHYFLAFIRFCSQVKTLVRRNLVLKAKDAILVLRRRQEKLSFKAWNINYKHRLLRCLTGELKIICRSGVWIHVGQMFFYDWDVLRSAKLLQIQMISPAIRQDYSFENLMDSNKLFSQCRSENWRPVPEHNSVQPTVEQLKILFTNTQKKWQNRLSIASTRVAKLLYLSTSTTEQCCGIVITLGGSSQLGHGQHENT